MKDITVLFVDDQHILLDVLKKFLEKEPYRTFFLPSGKEALEFMKKEPVHVIVSDMMMPGMDGLQLLKKIKKKHPDTIRIIFSACTQISKIIPSINSGEVYRYINKPLNPKEFKAVIKGAIEFYLLRKEKDELFAQLQKRNQELEEIMSKMEILEGLIPICSYCKNIRDDQNYWQRVENYITKHKEARFTHSICPDCWGKYVEPNLEKLRKKNAK